MGPVHLGNVGQILYDRKGDWRAVAWKLLAGYSDRRFEAVVDPQSMQTRRLQLNIYPTRVWRRDGLIVWRVVLQALRRIELLKRASTRRTGAPPLVMKPTYCENSSVSGGLQLGRVRGCPRHGESRSRSSSSLASKSHSSP